MPAHRHLARDPASSTRHFLAGVNYDTGRAPLAPTTLYGEHNEISFISDDTIGLLQCGDMVSCYTPGFEGAVLSATDAADHLATMIQAQVNATIVT